MNLESGTLLPVWAPRVKQHLIERLYELDAAGIRDPELLDEVGWGLLERCKSFISAVEAVQGRVDCPRCSEIIHHHTGKDEIIHCNGCGWELPWQAYFKTIQHKQLSGADAVIALFQDFIIHFPLAREAPQKMFLIDTLIHGFHWNLLWGNTRAVGVNLIEGNYHQVVDFLDRLSYGAGSTPGIIQTRVDWREKINRTAELWGDQRLQRSG